MRKPSVLVLQHASLLKALKHMSSNGKLAGVRGELTIESIRLPLDSKLQCLPVFTNQRRRLEKATCAFQDAGPPRARS